MSHTRVGQTALAIALIAASCRVDLDKLQWAPLCAAGAAGGQVGDSCSLVPFSDEAGNQWTCGCSQATTVNNYCIGSSIASYGTCFDVEWARWPVPPSNLADSEYELTEETVIDKTTDLVWQRSVSASTYTWADAKKHCEQLSLAGFSSGWRLPSRMELLTLVDYSRLEPAINIIAFPGTPYFSDPNNVSNGHFWSLSPYTETGFAWSVSFRAGGYIKNAVNMSFYARCVRNYTNKERAEAPKGQYTFTAGSPKVHDNQTKLTWQRGVSSEPDTLAAAAIYCHALSLEGLSWRLPHMRELTTLVDTQAQASRPAIDSAAFPDALKEKLWSASMVSDNSGTAWAVDFADGQSFRDAVAVPHRVRCVTP